jgi:hypothetical protein
VLLRRPHVLLLDEPTNHLDLEVGGGCAGSALGPALALHAAASTQAAHRTAPATCRPLPTRAPTPNPAQATEGLARALRAYPGAVVLASHDVRFVDEVLSAAPPARGASGGGASASAPAGGAGGAEVLIVGGGGVKRWTKGSVSDYADARLERMEKAVAAAAAAAGRRGG